MTSGHPTKHLFIRVLYLLIGLLISSFGTQAMIVASIGLNPRGILIQGIINQTHLRYGLIVQLLGLILILISALFHRYPGIGTICNVSFLGPFVDLFSLVPIWKTPENLPLQIIYFLVGQLILSFGMAIYLSQELGAGPRDGIMVMLIQLPHGSVVRARTLLDGFSAIVGYFLGGPIGIGSLLSVALSGLLLKYCFCILGSDPQKFYQENIVETIQAFCSK